MNGTMTEAAEKITAEANLAKASEAARKYWEEARKWKRIAQELGAEIIRREEDADVYIEVWHGAVIFREGNPGGC